MTASLCGHWPLHPGLAEELITRSGADAQTWISHLLATLLRPLLHLMHHYGITVNPHGENLAVITNPEYADRLSATALTAETFARYPLNAYRLTLGYTDLDARPPIPTTGRIPNPLHSAKPIS